MKKDFFNQRQHFSIRKLSVGVASVLIGTTFYLNSNNQVVKADELVSQNTTTQHINSTDSTQQSAEKYVSQNTVTNYTQGVSTLVLNQEQVAQPKDASASVDYPENKDNVAQGNWFKIHVVSGDLTDVKQGDTYKVQIGKDLPLNYDRSNITTPDFNVTNNGDGTFDLTAKGDYATANFDINASMSYTMPLASDSTIDVPVTISHENHVLKSMNVPVNMTPAPSQPEEETHPTLYYRCYGRVPGTDKLAWGVYVNYSKQELKDLDVTATFGGEQKLIPSSINVYTPTDVSQGINQTSYPDNTYSYDLSVNVQKDSNDTELHLDDNTINGYSNKPIYIYFQTEVPTYDEGKVDTYTSDIHLSAQGITPIAITEKPASSGNSGNSDGSNPLKPVSESKTVTETINYLEKGTDKVLADPHKAQVTFTRNGQLNTVTNETTWGDWSAPQDFDAVKSPEIKGYTTDTKTVAKQTVDNNSKDIVINVYYTKDAPEKVSESKTVTETINYLEKGTDKVLAPAHKTELTFTRTGEKDAVTGDTTWGNWTPSQTFDAVTSPVIKDYTTQTPVVNEQTVSHDSNNLNINVYYDKNKSQSGPTETTPTRELDYRTVTQTIHYVYKNGPQAGKVAAPDSIQSATFTRVGTNNGNGVVWGNWNKDNVKFDNVISPSIKDYVPSEATVEGDTVTPGSNNINITVYYTLHTDSTGPVVTTPVQTLDMDTVTETIHYVYRNTGKQAAADSVQKVTFTRIGTDDGKEIVWGNWMPEKQTFENVTSPVIDGYTASEEVVNGTSVVAGDKNIDVTVYYDKVEAPQIPNTPTTDNVPPTTDDIPPVVTPDIPTDTTPISNVPEKEKPITVVTITDKTPGAMGSSRMRNGVSKTIPKKTYRQNAGNVERNVANRLPQTGSKNAILPMLFGSLISLIGLIGVRRKKN